MSEPTIGIVGGSFGGMAAAISLRKVLPQANITIIEKRDISIRKGAILGMQVNSLRALKAIDEPMFEEINSVASLFPKYRVYNLEGELQFEDSAEMQKQKREFELETYGIASCLSSWYRFQEAIRKHIPPSIHTIHGIMTNVKEITDGVELQYSQNGKQKTMFCDLLVAADGHKSTVRSACQGCQFLGKEPKFQDRVYIWASLQILGTHNFSQPVDATHQLIGKQSSMLLMQPEENVVVIVVSEPVENVEAHGYRFDIETETFYNTSSGQQLAKKELLLQSTRVLPDFLQEYIREMQEDQIVLRAASFHTPQTWSTACYGQGRIVFVGDGAHTFRPTGQGAAQAFEDSYHLARLVQQHGIESSLGEKLGKIREERIRRKLEADQVVYQTSQKFVQEKKNQYDNNKNPKFMQDEETHIYIQDAVFEPLQ